MRLADHPLHIALDARTLQQSLINSPDGGLGGPGRYAYELLKALRRRDLEITLLLDHGPVPPRLNDLVASTGSFRVRRVGLGGRLPRRLSQGRTAALVGKVESPLLERQVRTVQPAVIHLVDQPPAPLRLRPRIVTLHDLGPAGAGALEARSPAGTVRRARQAKVPLADVVICVSEATRGDAARVLGIAPDRLEVVHPGVDTRSFHPDPTEDMRQELGLPESARYFLHVGTLRERKNPVGLLRAFRKLAAPSADLHLVCAGPYQTSPEASRRVRTLAIQLGVEARVHLAGDLPDETLARVYRGSVGLVFPSLHEGFGFPVAEALACGVPVVAADNSSMPEVGGDLAILVDARDHDAIAAGMTRLLEDEQLRRRVRAVGPRWVRRFSWSTAADRIHALYVELAQKHRP
jgi:glycosyltransferase involved in cell wall biosynthesis